MNLIDKYRSDTAAILGHEPGPGYDIAITPTNPVSKSWNLVPRSPAGKAYLAKVRNGNHLAIDNTDLQSIKFSLTEWGLSYFTDWSCVKVVRSDP